MQLIIILMCKVCEKSTLVEIMLVLTREYLSLVFQFKIPLHTMYIYLQINYSLTDLSGPVELVSTFSSSFSTAMFSS